jgi:Uma2 family endonuclease
MQLIAKQYYTPEEYLELEATANYKSEYIGRQIIAMAGASINHNRISLNLSSGLNFAFRNQNYEVFMGDMRLWIPQKLIYTYPDVIIIAAELWRYDGEVLKFYQLVENQYVEIQMAQQLLN